MTERPEKHDAPRSTTQMLSVIDRWGNSEYGVRRRRQRVIRANHSLNNTEEQQKPLTVFSEKFEHSGNASIESTIRMQRIRRGHDNEWKVYHFKLDSFPCLHYITRLTAAGYRKHMLKRPSYRTSFYFEIK